MHPVVTLIMPTSSDDDLDASIGAVGFIPTFLDEDDPRPAREQFNERYAHGGGWSPMKGFRLLDDNRIQYPGDPPYTPLVEMQLRDELIVVYPHAWVAIIQPDRSYEISRMD